MAFIHVPDRGAQAQRPQGPDSAQAQNDLLVDAKVVVATIELVSDGPVVLVVARKVGVQQENFHMPQTGFPHPHLHFPARQLNLYMDFIARLIEDRPDRQVVEIGGGVVGYLVALGIDGLGEIPLPVQNPNRRQRQAQVAGRLDQVSREHAQASRVQGDAFVKTELGAEIGHEVPVGLEVVVDLGAGSLAVVAVEPGEDSVILLHVHPIEGGLLQASLGDTAQENLWIVAAAVPQIRVQLIEQAADAPVPRVHQVVGELGQPVQGLRKPGLDLQLVSGSGHGRLASCKEGYAVRGQVSGDRTPV